MSARFSKDALKHGNGLACPFCKSDPARYKDQQKCRPDQGWMKVGGVSEHVWRCHAPLTHCEYCGHRWASLDREKKLVRARAGHIPGCRESHNGVRRVVEYEDREIMTLEQQDAFVRIKPIRDNARKFKEMYIALGKPLPETYHVHPLIPGPQARVDSNLFNGFQPPAAAADLSAPPPPPPTYSDISHQADAGSSSHQLVDSGYGSETQDKPLLVDAGKVAGPASPYTQWQNEHGLQYTLDTDHVKNDFSSLDIDEDDFGLVYHRSS